MAKRDANPTCECLRVDCTTCCRREMWRLREEAHQTKSRVKTRPYCECFQFGCYTCMNRMVQRVMRDSNPKRLRIVGSYVANTQTTLTRGGRYAWDRTGQEQEGAEL